MRKSDQNTLKSVMEAPPGGLDVSEYGWKLPVGGPFDLADLRDYEAWRAEKLAGFPQGPDDILVRISDLAAPTASETGRIVATCRRANMAIYQTRPQNIDVVSIRSFAAHFGLTRLDRHLLSDETGITALEVAAAGERQSYIPYSSHRLGWHTDGYYNDSTNFIRAVILHCVRPAATGGGNSVLDHEIAYIRLRDENPAFIAALMHPHCMEIPANPDDTRGKNSEMRPARTGPVFSLDPVSGALNMRFTARKRNITWRQDRDTQAAVDYLLALLEDNNGPAIHFRLAAGQGLISNNVLHNRTAFEDHPEAPRLVYRGRYLDRISDTQGGAQGSEEEKAP